MCFYVSATHHPLVLDLGANIFVTGQHMLIPRRMLTRDLVAVAHIVIVW